MNIVVSIVGKPNVGKSTLFNLLINKGISVVSDVEGTTRDVLIKSSQYFDYKIIFIDTGGIINSKDEIDLQVRQKVQDVLTNSDIVLFVVDNINGIDYMDIELADIIRKSGMKERTILVLNKSEANNTKEDEFRDLGFKNSIQISCKTKMNVKELVFMIKELFEKLGFVESKYRFYEEEGRKVGFVGRPNVGKSSIINSLLSLINQDERVIVSSIAGTTRDSIDIPFEYNGKKFVIIDTPGVRRKTHVSSKLEAYSITRALGTIKYADILGLVIDISEGLTRQDKRIVYQLYKHEKPCFIVANKFDLVIEDYKQKLGKKFNNQFIENLKYELADQIKRELYLIPFAPVIFVSAKTKYQIDSIIYTLLSIDEQLNMDLSKYDLKELLDSVLLSLPLINVDDKKVRMKVRDVKFYKEEIPTLKVYSNVDKVPDNIKSYLKNTLSRILNIPNVPLKLLFTKRKPTSKTHNTHAND